MNAERSADIEQVIINLELDNVLVGAYDSGTLKINKNC